MTELRIPIIKKWVERLRLPDMLQTTGVLRREYPGGEVAYCCLGVVCEIGVEEGVLERKGNTYAWKGTLRPGQEHVRENGLTLPAGFHEWLGFAYEDPNALNDSGEMISLSSLNDDSGYDFPEIADAIQKTYLDG